MGNFKIKNRNGKQVLIIEIEAPHQQVTPYWKNYDITKPLTNDTVKYSLSSNVTGHQQRSLLVWFSLKCFAESNGYPVVDLGGGGVNHPGSISVDWIGTGEEPVYGGEYIGVNIKADASKLETFGSESFSGIMSNHLAEHLPCNRYDGWQLPWQQKFNLNCKGLEIIETIRNVWARILRPGGSILMIIPDEDEFNKGGSSVLAIDPTHNHTYRSSTFREFILDPISDIFELIQFNTLNNEFSFDVILRKR